ncbi:MAG TPA: hypothetical protein VKD08_09265 [Ignavibacteriaceae bacterium]|nr:hypothetical protein [Ignavibacteriaceae bacterium]
MWLNWRCHPGECCRGWHLNINDVHFIALDLFVLLTRCAKQNSEERDFYDNLEFMTQPGLMQSDK